jgi:hypothetical protein
MKERKERKQKKRKEKKRKEKKKKKKTPFDTMTDIQYKDTSFKKRT